MTPSPRRGRRAILCCLLAASACAGPPWYMGEPLDGRPSIPDETRDPPPSRLRRRAEEARRRRHAALEIAALAGLARRSALRAGERARLVELLAARARALGALGRSAAEARDLARLDELDPAGAAVRARDRAAAERRAGDFWLAAGENASALRSYRWAEAHGARSLGTRIAAAEGRAPEPGAPASALAAAIAELPLRAAPPWAQAYLNAGGRDPALLRRGRRAALAAGRPALARRIDEALAAALAAPEAPDPGTEAPPAGARAPDPEARPRPPVCAGAGAPRDALLAGPTLAGPLESAYRACPERLAALGPATQIELALLAHEEDPVSPAGLEPIAFLETLAGRPDAAARKLVDFVYFSEDRAAALAAIVSFWRRTGHPPRAAEAERAHRRFLPPR